MQHSKNSAFGKNNFDRLEAAGLVAGEDVTAAVKTKTQARIAQLNELVAKITRVEAVLCDLYVLAKPARLKKLTQVLSAVKKLHASPLPVGSKKHIANCINELTSLREGVYATNAQIDRKALTLIAAANAKQELVAMISASESKLDKVMAESSETNDMEEFYRRAADVIQRHAHEAEKLDSIKTKPFMIARSPVVPADGAVSTDKLTRLGFKVESLGGYAVMHDQLVIGINPKLLLGEGAGAMKGLKAGSSIRDEADRLRKLLQKKAKVKLQFVSDKSFSYGSGTWFWLMSDRDLDSFARAFPGAHVKVQRWGFAFNSTKPTKGEVSK